MSSVADRLKARRNALEADLVASGRRRWLSPVLHGLHAATETMIRRHLRGRVLDIGAGHLPFEREIIERAQHYDQLDVEQRGDRLTYLGDVQQMDQIQDGSYDTVVCIEVLEHVPDPFRAVREIARVLVPGGVAIVSVPHLSRVHEAPHDYYRYTEYGLRRLLSEAGLEPIELLARGGLASFVGHQVSNGLVSATWGMPLLGGLGWFANQWLVVRPALLIDRLTGNGGLFAVGYTVAAVKPGSP